MTALRRYAPLLVFALATLGARGGVTTGPPRPTLSPSVVLANYAGALATLRRPKAVSFEYSVEQLGVHNLEQTHRVYRSGRSERDETLVVDGTKFEHPSIRILANRTDRYDVAIVAPKPAGYAFAFLRVQNRADGMLYIFKTRPLAPSAFAVSEVAVDARSFLPAVVRFKIVGGSARGGGELHYGRADVYWVVRLAQVNVRLRNGTTAHERIAWTNYQFPTSLPRSTFEAPRATPTPSAPLLAPATPTPTPIPPPL